MSDKEILKLSVNFKMYSRFLHQVYAMGFVVSVFTFRPGVLERARQQDERVDPLTWGVVTMTAAAIWPFRIIQSIGIEFLGSKRD